MLDDALSGLTFFVTVSVNELEGGFVGVGGCFCSDVHGCDFCFIVWEFVVRMEIEIFTRHNETLLQKSQQNMPLL